MKKHTNLSIIPVILIIYACSSSENQINNKFYTELNRQLNSGYFSAIDFAGQFKPKEHGTNWDFNNDIVIAEDGDSQIQFRLNELSIQREDKRSNNTRYIIRLYRGNKVTNIVSLTNGIKEENKVTFELQKEAVRITITPFNGFFKWDIIPVNDISVDSIVIEVNSPGPYYGGGERYISTKLDGRTISNQPNDHYWDPPITELTPWGNPHEPGHYNRYEPTYLQLAYYLNPFGDAWFIDDAASVLATFAENASKFKIRIENSRTVFYTIHKQSAKEALTTFTSIVGRQPELPDWAVGVWVNLLDGQDSVIVKARRLKEWNIPVTAIWVFDMSDIPNSQGWGNWTTGTYHCLKAMNDSLHKLGFKTLSYLSPFQNPKLLKSDIDNPTYHKFDSLGLLLKPPKKINERYAYEMSGLYNFHKPLMGDMWQDMLRKVLLQDNFDGFMEDFGDLSYYFDREEKKWVAFDYGQETPLTPNEYNNTYPLIYHKLSYLQASEMKPDAVTFCRSGSLGSAAYTKILWAGDQIAVWDKTFGYPSAISSGISCGLSGYANWTPDILSASPDMELWKRWVQFAAFTPIMRDHLWDNKPEYVDIWFNNETPKYFKKYAEIHMSLVPYIQEHLAEYRSNGVPLIRHMMLDFPDEPETYNCEYQYMFGSKYLVAPVVEQGAVEKIVYFPKGNWKSFWDSSAISSKGEYVTVKAPLDTIPVYERIHE